MAGLHLTRAGENSAEIDALAASLGTRVGIDGLMADLPGRLRRTFAPHPRLLGLKVSRAYTWEAADRRDRRWWPQGITTSAQTGLSGRHGHDVLATSWYAKGEAGSRISIVDVERRRYGHVLLVTPTLVEGRPGFAPLKVHAGGIVWHDDHLHVAATGRGFLTCRMSDIVRIDPDSPYDAHGHRYLLPVRFSHRGVSEEGTERLRFSFFTLDRSGTEPALLVGEYGSPRQTRRLARFALDPATGLPQRDEHGRALPEITDDGIARMQGVAVADGRHYFTRSRGPTTPGSVYVGRPGALREHRWATPMGPEDLVWWPETGALWSVSEHPRRRWIFAMNADSFH